MSPVETRNLPDFDSVYYDFLPRIRRYLERLVGPNDAENLTQKVFVKVSQGLPESRGDASLSTWIYRIATNAAYDRLRSPSRQRTNHVAIDDVAPVADRAPGVEPALVRQEMSECVNGYVTRLPASYRSVFELNQHEGLTNQEIADVLGITVDTAKIRLHRARARLRKELGSGCDLYRDDRNELACEPKPGDVSLKG